MFMFVSSFFALLALLVQAAPAAPQSFTYVNLTAGITQQLPIGWRHVPPDEQRAARQMGHQKVFGADPAAAADDVTLEKCARALLWLVPEGDAALSEDPVPTFVLAEFDLACLAREAPQGARKAVELPKGRQRTYLSSEGVPIQETTMNTKVRLTNGKKQRQFAAMRVALRKDRVLMWAIAADSKQARAELLQLPFTVERR
jgi:hypothetical protein